MINGSLKGGKVTKREILAVLLGAVGMFVWGFIAHTMLPLGEAGVREIPNDQTVLTPMQTTLGSTDGFYIFPSTGGGTNQEKMEQYSKKLASSPNGILVYHPAGGSIIVGRQLTIEFLTQVLVALLAIALLKRARVYGFASILGFITLIGLIATVMTNIQYWNWYGFPAVYTLGYMTSQFVGFLIFGLIASAMLKRAPVPAAVGVAA
jgi:hypothetical protein